MISARTKAALAAAKRRGVKLGGTVAARLTAKARAAGKAAVQERVRNRALWILRPRFSSYGRAVVSHCGPCSGIGGARHSCGAGRQVVRCSGGALVGGGQHSFRRKLRRA